MHEEFSETGRIKEQHYILIQVPVRQMLPSHTLVRQSAFTKHAAPVAHAGQLVPPQSTAVSSPFNRLSLHDPEVGEDVGALVGTAVGELVGSIVGAAVVGARVGEAVGAAVGALVGLAVGAMLGKLKPSPTEEK
jgi:hypothetical protein